MSKPEVIQRRAPLTQAQAAHKAETLDDKKKRIAQILSVGRTAEMLRVKHQDPNKRYAYIRDRDVDIDQYRSLGYELELNQPQGGGHATGDSRIKVGDVVLMSIGREEYNLIEEVKDEMVKRRHEVNPGQRDYMQQAQAAADRGEAAPPIDFTKGGQR